jgi:hypothetical protein
MKLKMLLRSAPYESYFFDDDEWNVYNVQRHCRYVKSVLIDKICVPYESFQQGFNGNTYFKLMDQIRPFKTITTGFTEVEPLLTWAQKTGNIHKAVFFDWDHTLSVMEGILPFNPVNYGATYREMAEYYVGGVERFVLLRQMFETLTALGMPVYILTNNPICTSDHPVQPLDRYNIHPFHPFPPFPLPYTQSTPVKESELFYCMVKELFPNIPRGHLLGAGKNTKYGCHKGYLLQDQFTGFC